MKLQVLRSLVIWWQEVEGFFISSLLFRVKEKTRLSPVNEEQ